MVRRENIPTLPASDWSDVRIYPHADVNLPNLGERFMVLRSVGGIVIKYVCHKLIGRLYIPEDLRSRKVDGAFRALKGRFPTCE